MSYWRAYWLVFRAFPLWQRLGFVVFNLLGVSISSIGPFLEFYQGVNIWGLYLLWVSTTMLAVGTVLRVGELAWKRVDAERNSLSARLSPRIAVEWSADCRMCSPTADNGRILNVGLRNKSAISVKNVKTTFSIEPLPAELSGDSFGSSPIQLDPESRHPERYDQHVHLFSHFIGEGFIFGESLRPVRIQEYTILVRAQGEDIVEVQQLFRVGFDASRLAVLLPIEKMAPPSPR